MNREIKFRAWNTTDEVMIAHREVIERAHLQFNDELDFHTDVVMQYTGIIDRNGVEIYEGDIFIIGAEEMIFEVKFEYGCFMAYYEGKQYGLIGELQQCFIKVIGNIFEQPELITTL